MARMSSPRRFRSQTSRWTRSSSTSPTIRSCCRARIDLEGAAARRPHHHSTDDQRLPQPGQDHQRLSADDPVGPRIGYIAKAQSSTAALTRREVALEITAAEFAANAPLVDL